MPAPQYAREIPARYRLEGARCQACGKTTFPARRVCPECRGTNFEPQKLPREGKLMTWTVIHVAAAGFARQTPYAVGIVELSEGVRVTAQIVDCDPEELRVGIAVHAVLRRVSAEGEGGILRYGYKFVVDRSLG
jgi:scaffold protein (connect acetoacetyl-CoA thiolase and HMG-CoA synthase)